MPSVSDSLSELGARRSPPLHRTLPTWAREPFPGLSVDWRLYAPCRGAALFVHVSVPVFASRADAAAALRRARASIWGRDKVRAVAAAALVPAAEPQRVGLSGLLGDSDGPVLYPDVPQSPPPHLQGSLF